MPKPETNVHFALMRLFHGPDNAINLKKRAGFCDYRCGSHRGRKAKVVIVLVRNDPQMQEF